jgi:beta-ribofuranosylaminobenzene 5'-phosphate synthase
MVEQPGLRLELREDPALVATGRLSMRAIHFAHAWARFHGRPPPAARIRIVDVPAEHAGLGTGTQLGLSVAAGLNALFGLPSLSPQELAIAAGRGLRSAVGTYGFVHGGLIVEQGKLPGEPISPLDCRIDLPAAWRFVLVRPAGVVGLTGADEAAVMAALPEVPADVTAGLIALAGDQIVPAAATANFEAFAAGVHEYGRRAGELFAARQGGPYNGPVLAELVSRIQSLGYQGVGQSSWGPTLFVACRDQATAEQLARQLRKGVGGEGLDLAITPPANHGASIHVAEM